MMAIVSHVTSGLGLRNFQADGFLLTRVYMRNVFISNLKLTAILGDVSTSSIKFRTIFLCCKLLFEKNKLSDFRTEVLKTRFSPIYYCVYRILRTLV